MWKISKKKNSSKHSEETPPKQPEIEEQELTPWQKENQEYLKQKGTDPVWKPSVVADEETDTSELETDEHEEQISEENGHEQDSEKDHDNGHYESFADRLPNVKKVRNKLLYRRLTVIVSILLLAVIIVLYFVSPLSKLSEIKVTGNRNIDSQTIIEQSKLVKGDDLWQQFSKRDTFTKNIVRKSPRVKEATISLNGINSFQISIKEYKVVALEAENGIYRPILENGKILGNTSKTAESGKPIFENFKDESLIQELMKSYAKLPSEIKQGISEIKYAPSKSNKELVNVYMNDKNQVIVNISQLSEKMAYYSQVAGQMEAPGVIDMEVGIFSYPYENESTEESQVDSTEVLQEN